MSIKYYKLFDLLNRRGMKKSDLRQVLASATVAKLSKGENITVDAIEKICMFLHCQPGDIMEMVEDEVPYTGGVVEYKTQEIDDHSIEGPINVTAVSFRDEETGELLSKEATPNEE